MAPGDSAMLSILEIGVKYITERLLLIVALVMAFSLFAWSLWMGTLLSLCVAGAFAILVFLPVLLKGESRVREKEV